MQTRKNTNLTYLEVSLDSIYSEQCLKHFSFSKVNTRNPLTNINKYLNLKRLNIKDYFALNQKIIN